MRSTGLGYRARWHVLGYRYYGLDWDITGLHLTPTSPEPGVATLAIIHGGSANWYEFFVDAPLTHYGHLERPKQLAAARWARSSGSGRSEARPKGPFW